MARPPRFMALQPNCFARPEESHPSQSAGIRIRPLTGHMGQYFGRHGAAVHVLPVRAGGMAADRLALEQERRDRLAEYPGELAIAARLALINLGALRM